MKLTHPAIKYATLIVWVHLLIAIAHGLSHFANHNNLSPLGDAFVIGIILLAPLLALLLLRTSWQRLGGWLLTCAMLASLLFGLLNHFILPGSDNINQVMPGMWHSSFLISSILVLISEAVGMGIGIWCLFALTQFHGQQRERASKSFTIADENVHDLH